MKVKCLSPSEFLEKDKVYIVKSVSLKYGSERYYDIKDEDNTNLGEYKATRFEIVKTTLGE